MATENMDQSFGDFGIKDTMEMGLGNAQLLNDLYSPETSTSPEDITPIVEKVTNDPPVPEKKARGKEIEPSKEGEEPDSTKGNAIANFLGNNEEDDEDDASSLTDKAPATKETEETPSEENQFSALSRDLFKLGVFSKEDDDDSEEDISTPEAFLDRFNSEKRKGAIEMVNNFIGQFGEDYQQAFDAIFVKGVDPKNYFQAYNKAVSFAEMDLSVESNQEAVMRQSLTDQGFDSEDVDTEIERLKNYGDLEVVSARNHKVLVKKEAAKMQEMEQKAQTELAHKAEVKQQFISNVNSVIEDKLKTKEFDGIPLNAKLAGELHDFLLVDKYKTQSGETLTDFDKMILDLKRPENHSQKVKIALLLKVLEKDPTLSTIQKTGITKNTDQMFSDLTRQSTKTKISTGATSSKGSSWNL